MKAAIEAGPATGAGYTPEAFEAALKAGAVDVGKVNETLDGFNDSARKLILKLSAETSQMSKELVAEDAAADFSKYEGVVDAEILAKVKALTDASVAEIEAMAAADSTADAAEKELRAVFEGSNGLLEIARKEEIAAAAGMKQCLAEMEDLKVYVDGVADITIAEILEREPELREKVEDEIKNNVWAP